MGLRYNPDEIFTLAIQIEKNGHQFYKSAADLSSVAAIKELFLELAEWEVGHVDIFERLAQTLPSRDPISGSWYGDDEARAYFNSVAESHVFVKSDDTIVSHLSTPREALSLALRFEKESIALYEAARKLLPSTASGVEELDRLIAEEYTHVDFIEKAMAKLADTL